MLSNESIGLWINIPEHTQSALNIFLFFSFFEKYKSSLSQQNVHRSTCYKLILFGIEQLQRGHAPQCFSEPQMTIQLGE